MKISLIVIGRLKSGPETELFQKYFDRAKKSGAQIGLDFGKVSEFPESRQDTADLRKKEEAEKILGALAPGNVLICLDERGDNLSSQKLSASIMSLRDDGVSEICFVIGGPDGLSAELRQKSRLNIAFGKLTYPHMIMRILLVEQLYRSITIATGHPYHRE